MLVAFQQKYLKELYEKGKSSGKKHRFQPEVVRGYQKCIRYLLSANRIEDLYPVNSLNLEALRGNKEGLFSVRANGKYRVEFEVSKMADTAHITICNILELSNHYK